MTRFQDSKGIVSILLLGASLLIWPQAAGAQAKQPGSKLGEVWKIDAESVNKADQEHDANSKLRDLLKFHSDFPNSARVLRNLAWAAESVGRHEEAMKFLRQYAAMGMGLRQDSPIYSAFSKSGVLDTIPAFQSNKAQARRGELVFRLQDPNLIVEDIAFDSQTKHLFLSSVHENKILECDLKGKCLDAIQSSLGMQLDAVLAIHVDTSRKLLWATTAGMNMQADFRSDREGHSSLLKFDLVTHHLIQRYEPMDGHKHALGDMTISSDGDAYISDGASGDLYVVRHDRNVLEKLVPSGVFVSPQTPALDATQQYLYVPDYAAGIAIIDLRTGSIEWVKSSRPAALDGIDGLYWTKDGLVATQNGTYPERIVRFHLKTRDDIDNSEVLEANWPGFGDPTHGVIVSDMFYFIANSGWDRVADDGSLRPGTPPTIWRMRLDAAAPKRIYKSDRSRDGATNVRPSL